MGDVQVAYAQKHRLISLKWTSQCQFGGANSLLSGRFKIF